MSESYKSRKSDWCAWIILKIATFVLNLMGGIQTDRTASPGSLDKEIVKRKEKIPVDEEPTRKPRIDEEISKPLLQLNALSHAIPMTRSLIKQSKKAPQTRYISILHYDVLVLIFSNATDPSKTTWLLDLSHVCRWWREVTISTPALWARNVRISRSWYPRLFQLYVERAKECPLDIVMNHNGTQYAQAVNALVSCMGRCRTLEIYLPAWNLASSMFLLHLADISAPCLEKLVVGGSNYRSSWPVPILKRGAPRLSSLALHIKTTSPTPLLIGGGLNTLTSLKFHAGDIPDGELLDLLRGLPLLKSLQLADISYPLQGNPAPVELNNLLFLEATLPLRIHNPHNNTGMGSILSILDAPLLNQLALDFGGCDYERAMEYGDSIKRYPPAFPAIHTLIIEGSSGYKALPFLSDVFPRITHLEVDSGYIKSILETLDSVLWDSLKQLRFANSECVDLIKIREKRKH